MRNHLSQNWNARLRQVVTLTNQGAIQGNYSTQYQLAKIFSSFSKEHFWATSFDTPSEFAIKNFEYLHLMGSMRLRGYKDNDLRIPQKARIFILSFEDLIRDIYENKSYLLEVVKYHLDFDKDSNTLLNSCKLPHNCYQSK